VEFAEFADLPVIDGHAHFGEFGAGKTHLTAESLRKQGEFMVEVMKKR